MTGTQAKDKVPSEFEERGKLIEAMLDKIYPLKEGMSEDDRESVDTERQLLAMRAGWSTMPLDELRKLAEPALPKETGIIDTSGRYTGTDFYCDVAIPRKIPLRVVHEDEHVLAFHHTKPFYPVHIVVVPKRHVRSLVDICVGEQWILHRLMSCIQSIATDMLELHGKVRVITNLGEYQDSKHLHFHVVSGDALQK